jgi:hypothetical protein
MSPKQSVTDLVAISVQSYHFFFIVKNENLEEKEYFGIISVRILVHKWPMTSGSSLQLIVIQEEVVEIDGKQVRYYAC